MNVKLKYECENILNAENENQNPQCECDNDSFSKNDKKQNLLLAS